jgi:hypothetical protein
MRPQMNTDNALLKRRGKELAVLTLDLTRSVTTESWRDRIVQKAHTFLTPCCHR